MSSANIALRTCVIGGDKILPRSVVCSSQSSSKLSDVSLGAGDIKRASCLGAGVSPVLVGIITALVTALLTGLIVMAMMKFACNDSNRVQSSGKREA